MNFLKRFTAAAVALVMVLVMVPAGALTADAATNNYVFDASTLPGTTDKEALAAGTYGDNGYFTMAGTITKRVSSGAVNRIELAKNAAGTISFEVSGTATVTVTARSTGNGNISDIVLTNVENNTAVAEANGATTVSDSTFTTLTYNNVAAGTYTISTGNPHDHGRGVQVGTVTVVESVDHEHNYTTEVIAPTCTEKGYTTHTCTVCGDTYNDTYVDATGHNYDATTGVCVCGRCVHTVDSTNTFSVTELTTAADHEVIPEGTTLGTNGFFTVTGIVDKRLSGTNGVKSVELKQAAAGSIDFTLTGTADVTVVASSTSGSNTSAIALLNPYGEVETNNEGKDTVTGTGETTLTYSNLTAGKYSLVTPENPEYARNVRIYSITVNESSNLGCEHNPHVVQFTKDETGAFTATYTIPANTTHYFEVYNQAGATLFIDGAEHGVLEGNMRTPDKFTIANNTTAEAVHVLKLVYPEGTADNPTVLENIEHFTTNTTEGNDQGYYYTYTVPATGTITLSASTTAAGVEPDLIVNGDKWLSADGVDGVLTLPVSQGDVLSISVIAFDAVNWSYPAVEVVCTGSFAYPEGSEQNPILVEFEWIDDITATVTVNAPVGTTYYQAYGVDGMLLTVGDQVYDTLPNGGGFYPAVFPVTNSGDAAADIQLTVVYPVGSDMNPEKLETMHDINVSLAEENQGYYYTYTAEGDGVITMSATVAPEATPFNVIMSNDITYASKYLDSDAVDGVITLPVSKGDVVSINVYTYDINYGSAPAATVDVKAAFKEVPRFNIAGVSMSLGNSLAMYYYVPADEVTEDCYAEITMAYSDFRFNKAEVPFADWTKDTVDGKEYYLIPYDGIAAKEMTENLKCVVYNAEGAQISNPKITSVETYALKQLGITTDANLRTVLVDMLNYGAAAQEVFKYTTAPAANAQLTNEQKAWDTDAVDMTTLQVPDVKGDGWKGCSLILESNIQLAVFFNNTVVTQDMTAKISYTDHYGDLIEYEIPGSAFETYDDTTLYVNVETLVAADLETVVNVDIYNGETLVSHNQCNMAQYCTTVESSEGLDLMVTTLIKYCQAAHAYFHPVNS